MPSRVRGFTNSSSCESTLFEVRLPFVLRAVEGDTARVEFEGEGAKSQEKVKKGDTIRGTKLKVDKVETRMDYDKHGEKVDMTQIVLTDADSGDRVIALKDTPTRTSASFATLVDAEGESVLKVREGDSFEWPSEPGVRYKVIDLRHDQVVVKDEQSGKTDHHPARVALALNLTAARGSMSRCSLRCHSG